MTVNTVRIAARSANAGTQPTLAVQFKVAKNLSREPNVAEVMINNLSEASRSAMGQKLTPVVIEAGYVGSLGQIFSGYLTYASHTRQGTEWVTHFQSGDGTIALQQGRISDSLGPGATVLEAVKKAIDATGLGYGNALDEIQKGNFKEGLTEFTKGLTLAGRAVDVLDDLLRTTGLEWSIQDGQVQVLRDGQPNDPNATVLSPTSGMVGSPEIGDDGVVKIRALMQPALRPGSKIEVRSRGVNGFFRVQAVLHTGDSWGDDWYTDIEAKSLDTTSKGTKFISPGFKKTGER